MFLRRFRRKGDFGVRRNWEGSGSCVLMSVRDMDVLRLLCWCQNVRPDDLSSISTETERENLITLGLIKRHQRSDTLLLTNSGRAFLQAALEGDVPNLTLSYHDAAIERRVRLSSLMMTAYHAGINVWAITSLRCGRHPAGRGGSIRPPPEWRYICSTTPIPCRQRL